MKSQFEILKDGILRRHKEYNINGPLGKLLAEFNNHYKDKLLSVASGTFDGIYSQRYCCKDKTRTKAKKTAAASKHLLSMTKRNHYKRQLHLETRCL